MTSDEAPDCSSFLSFSSFLSPERSSINAAVIGASGGIGKAFVAALHGSKDVAALYALSRVKQHDEDGRIKPLTIDITSEDSIAEAAAAITKPLHLLIVATGTLHQRGTLHQTGTLHTGATPPQPGTAPEKNVSHLNIPQMQHSFAINTIGPALILKHFMPLMDSSGKTLIAALSARVGSVSDNSSGGWYSYRASKAALNMIIKSAAIEHRRKNSESLIIGLHPGTVDTNLSRPFTARLPAEKLFTPTQSVQKMLQVINNTDTTNNGHCLAYDGTEITP